MILQKVIRKIFSHYSWNEGSITFREGGVSNVEFHDPVVSGIVRPALQKEGKKVSFQLHRDGIQAPQCGLCQASSDRYCEHVAALLIWWMARGSLLRAGVVDLEEGASKASAPSKRSSKKENLSSDESNEKSEKNSRVSRKPKHLVPQGLDMENPLPAQALTYLHWVIRDDHVSGISLEPAVGWHIDGKFSIEMAKNLQQFVDLELWKSPRHDLWLKIDQESVPFLDSLHAPKVTFMGQTAVQMLGKILSHPLASRVIKDPLLKAEYVRAPLKLTRFEIGAKHAHRRSLKFIFSNGSDTLTSEELKDLAFQGRLSSDYAWRGDRIYRFESSLALLAKQLNRSGVNFLEATGLKPIESMSELEDSHEQPLHPLAIFRMSLELGADDFVVDDSWHEFHEWKSLFDRKSIPGLPQVDYGFDLREYQHNGLTWLWSLYHRGLSGFLADDMGLGKTHQVLAFLTSIYKSKQAPKEPTIVVAPTSVVAAWQQKLQRYPTGLRWQIYHGSGRQIPDPQSVDVIITTYGVLQRDSKLRQQHWHLAVVDESQAMKNAATSTSRIVRTLKARFRIAMTGTPVENASTDLWSVFEFLLPGYLGSQSRFKRLYGTKGETLSGDRAKTLKRLISPFLLRRTKSQVLKELPEKTEEVILCELTRAQRNVYNSYLRSQEVSRIRDELQLEKTRIDYTGILALLTKLKQVCDHPTLPELTSQEAGFDSTRVDPLLSGKWEPFEEIVGRALASNLKVVVFTQFLSMLDLMRAWCERRGILISELRGDTRDRARELERFRDNPECKVFLCSLMAGGLGIDLTAGSVCIHYDRWWNPARENQATDRLHRIGQTRGVQVFKLQCPGTVEDRIANIIQRKIALSDSLIEDSSLGLKSFSRDELLSLLTELTGSDSIENSEIDPAASS